jgi:hypothetical protein
MWNARPLAEFNQSGWIQVDFAPLINYRRKEDRQHVAKLVEDIFDQEMSGESIQKIFEEEREQGDEGWIDRFDNSRIYDEEREEYNRDEPSDSKDKWEEKGLKLEGYSLCSIEAHGNTWKYSRMKKRVNQRRAILTTCGTQEIRKVTDKTLKTKTGMTMKTSNKRQMRT